MLRFLTLHNHVYAVTSVYDGRCTECDGKHTAASETVVEQNRNDDFSFFSCGVWHYHCKEEVYTTMQCAQGHSETIVSYRPCPSCAWKPLHIRRMQAERCRMRILKSKPVAPTCTTTSTIQNKQAPFCSLFLRLCCWCRCDNSDDEHT